jgi:hypothetical protein
VHQGGGIRELSSVILVAETASQLPQYSFVQRRLGHLCDNPYAQTLQTKLLKTTLRANEPSLQKRISKMILRTTHWSTIGRIAFSFYTPFFQLV